MPIRPAQWIDIPIMARVKAAAFNPDRLFEVLFRHKNEYPDDMVTAFRRKVKLDEVAAQNQDLMTMRNGHYEIITGICEWQRVGLGWESVWNVWGWWDPRCLVQKFLKFRNAVAYLLRPCRASTKPSLQDPIPLVYSNFHARVGPFYERLQSNPLIPWRKNHWSLDVLCIHPLFQGRGCGKDLTEWGLAKAKCDTASGVTNLPVVVVAAEGKERFYQKVGFRELVGWTSRSVEGLADKNPMEERDIGGGAMLWSWVTEDEDMANKKVFELEKA